MQAEMQERVEAATDALEAAAAEVTRTVDELNKARKAMEAAEQKLREQNRARAHKRHQLAVAMSKLNNQPTTLGYSFLR